MKFFLSVAVLVFASFNPAITEALEPQGAAARYVTKPGVELHKRVRRHLNRQKLQGGYFGALAVSKTNGRKWYESMGLNSVKAAADIARLSCEAKAGSGHECEVVALLVPKSMPGEFSQLLKSSGLSSACEMEWIAARQPEKRPMGRWGGCWIDYVSESRPNQHRAREGGHTMYIARNDFYSDVLTFGPDTGLAKRAALKSCQANHTALLKSLQLQRWRNPNERISNAADLTIEARVTSAYLENNKHLARCRIVHQEILP